MKDLPLAWRAAAVPDPAARDVVRRTSGTRTSFGGRSASPFPVQASARIINVQWFASSRSKPAHSPDDRRAARGAPISAQRRGTTLHHRRQPRADQNWQADLRHLPHPECRGRRPEHTMSSRRSTTMAHKSAAFVEKARAARAVQPVVIGPREHQSPDALRRHARVPEPDPRIPAMLQAWHRAERTDLPPATSWASLAINASVVDRARPSASIQRRARDPDSASRFFNPDALRARPITRSFTRRGVVRVWSDA
jgi:hypothetical protein